MSEKEREEKSGGATGREDASQTHQGVTDSEKDNKEERDVNKAGPSDATGMTADW